MNSSERIGIGTDHAGVVLKEKIGQHLQLGGYSIKDYGVNDTTPCDYPDIAIRIAEAVASGEISRAILVCGTGIGMSIAANKVKGVRAALCTSQEAARLSRDHNNANMLVLAGRDNKAEDPLAIVDAFVETPFSNDERHVRRISKIAEYEKR